MQALDFDEYMSNHKSSASTELNVDFDSDYDDNALSREKIAAAFKRFLKHL